MESAWSEHFAGAFTPHGHCYLWRTDLLMLHAVSDFLIGLAYFSIPLALWMFVKKRTDLAFNWMFLLFAGFIFTCGTTHFLEVWNIWNADFYLSGAIKALTAGISVATAALLWPLIPKALALPSPQELRAINEQLSLEIERRHRVEEALRESSSQLENRVVARTRELESARSALEHEIRERRLSESDRESLVERLRDLALEADHRRAELEAVFESINDGIAVLDMNRNLVITNPALQRFLETPVDNAPRDPELVFQNYEALELSGQRVPKGNWPSDRVLRGEVLDELEMIGRRLDTGDQLYFSFSGTPVYDDEGKQILGVLVIRDITARKHSERAREEAEQRLKQAVSLAKIGFWEVSIGQKNTFLSPEWKEQLGYTDIELPNTLETWAQRLHPDDRATASRYLEQYMLNIAAGKLQEYRLEYRLRHRDGSYRWMSASAMPGVNDAGDVVRVVGTQLDITERKSTEQRIRQAAQHDILTGLPNRALIFEHGSLLLAAARRRSTQLAFLFVDLDRFKPVNDLYGHEIGDRLLQEIANRLSSCVRDGDLVGRLGGDEFLIILSEIGKSYPVGTVAQHVLRSLLQPFRIQNIEVSISASIGISHFPEDGNDIAELIRNADLAMYKAKFASPGNFQIYSPELNELATVASSTEARLKRAIRQDDLVLHYQPVVDMNSGRVVGAEALMRLRNLEGQPIPPSAFIPVAESAGLITQLGEWAITETCRQHWEWTQAGLEPMTIAVNVSPLQFRQRGFLSRLKAIVRESGIDPHCFQIEVTESTVMDNLSETIRILREIRQLGIRIALDDFGTGYSSLSHLSHLPLDKLKVDQSFVHNLEQQASSRAIIEAILVLGRTLDLEVVGEGIETPFAMNYMQSHGCDQAQGYLISKPLSPSEFDQWYRSWSGFRE